MVEQYTILSGTISIARVIDKVGPNDLYFSSLGVIKLRVSGQCSPAIQVHHSSSITVVEDWYSAY